MDGLISISGVLALLLLFGGALGLLDRPRFSLRWLLIAVLLVEINDACLTRGYGSLPRLLDGEWNWDGKLFAFAATLFIAELPAFGWRRVGLTLDQKSGSLKSAGPVALLYCTFFIVIAIAFPGQKANPQTIVFQLTMPGLEEEVFYRGVLLYVLDQAFTGRKRLLGVDWGWGAVLSCFLFGLAHAFGFSNGHFSFDVMTMALTATPSFIAVWLRLRTGSVLLPILLHNFGNSFSLFA